MRRLYADIPNSAFRKIVQLYAFDHGSPVLTIEDQYYALLYYNDFAITRN